MKGKLDEILEHVKSCNEVIIICENCKQETIRKIYSEHISKCFKKYDKNLIKFNQENKEYELDLSKMHNNEGKENRSEYLILDKDNVTEKSIDVKSKKNYK